MRVAALVAGSMAVFGLTYALAPSSAAACSCIAREPSQYVAEASIAFVGRAVDVQQTERTATTRLEVLHAIKGSPGREHVIRRPGSMASSCDRTFERGEVALVLVAADGDVSICAGNYAIEMQLPRLMEYLALGPDARTPAPPEAVAAAVAAIPGPGARTVLDRQSAGRSVTVGTTPVRFVARRGAFRVEAGRFGSVAFVAVSSARGRTRWLTLLRLQPDGAWSSVSSSEETRCPDGRWRPSRWGC